MARWGITHRLYDPLNADALWADARTKAAAKGEKPAQGRESGGRKTEFVNVTVVDAIPGYVTVPTDYTQDMIEALRQPYAVAVDQTAPAIPAEKSGAPADTDEGETAEDELRCEEAILNAFAPR